MYADAVTVYNTGSSVFTESQNEVGRDLCRSSRSTTLLKQGYLEHLQGRRLTQPPWAICVSAQSLSQHDH